MALLERLGIVEKADAKVDALSGGQQQRLMIARALLHEPQVVFLDEPTVGLDPQARLAFWDILRGLHAEGRTIVMTTHYMEEADQLCERIAIIDRGVLLACDTPAVAQGARAREERSSSSPSMAPLHRHWSRRARSRASTRPTPPATTCASTPRVVAR